MTWPHATDYNAAVQNPQLCFRDEDLRQGQTVGDLFDLPRPHSGNFADVYQIQGADGQSWAVKCFTRPVTGLRRRYHAISEHLRQAQRAFMVEFHFLDEGICICGEWHPIVKMRWIEGLGLNEFVREQLSKPVVLDRLAQMWIRLAHELRDANMAHGDLQHGNVLLVPSSKNSLLSLKLIDYDGMFVPALAHFPSAEVGHANFQHPRRLREGWYDTSMDCFSHLLIYTALRCLRIGGQDLWQRYDNQENLLFREKDFRQPRKSVLLHELWDITDRDTRNLVGHLLLASQAPVGVVPTLDDLVDDSGVRPLSDMEEARINDLLDDDTVTLSRDRKGAVLSPALPHGRGSAVAGRAKTQIALAPAEATVDDLLLTDTRPIPVAPVPPPLPKRRPSTAEINLEALPLEPETADQTHLDVGTLADPLISMLSRPAWLATLGVIALISFLVVNVLVWSSVKQPPPPLPRPILADIRDTTLRAGYKNMLHFTIHRRDFRHPLTVRLEGLPDELPTPPLTLPAEEDTVSLTLVPPLDFEPAPYAAHVSLWDGDDKIDEKAFQVSIQPLPHPLLKKVENISCQAGQSSTFAFQVQRNQCREPLRVQLERLPPQVMRQESTAQKDADTLNLKLTIAADAAAQPMPVTLQLIVGDVVADSKNLLLIIRKDDKLTLPQAKQQTHVRLKDKPPPKLAVEPGKPALLPVEFERGNYQGVVNLQLDGLPEGATAAPVAVPAGQSAANVILAAVQEVPLGEHRVKLRVQVHEQTVDERDITLSIQRSRGQQEIVHFTTVDHLELTGTLYHGWKGKKGMTVLMLHDLEHHHRNSPGWKRLAETLQAEGHTVLTFDFRGHGDSKKVSTPFWNFSVNKYLRSHDAALTADKQPRILDVADLPTFYRPWLIEDIVAARTYLDVRHDEPNGPINTFNLVVIGAGQAAAFGSLWLATEGLRYNGADISGRTIIKPPEKLSVLQVVWLGMTDPLKLNPKGIYSWLKAAASKPVVPITFVYGQNDIDTASLLQEPIQQKYGSPYRLPDARQSGQDLLDKNGKSAERIKQYLDQTLQKLPPQAWVPRRIKTLHSYWAIPQRLSGGREQLRFYTAKRVGEETLVPVPFVPLEIPIKGLVEPQPLPSTLEQ